MNEFGSVLLKEQEISVIKPKWTLENIPGRVLDNVTKILSNEGE